ncbi:Aste57867_2112 [Aphanomyces stellatus]|uniref:Aste57867_2112 protein n=1 Tax=Aphanomyces stellatus TaxID=120398 RepID=A0A485K7F6_9STRA|nr:hypothetical protein As57867_002107 [Aphanomyces stellatus]VFT79315.1 Aste57867_2112 [Aphanomyces stellatus]
MGETSASPGPGAGGYVSVWDARPVKYKNVLISVCGFILLMELAERLSYYGINQGLKNFMGKKLGWSSVSSNSIKSTWTSLVYMSPLLGAYIADERLGRFKTIGIFGTLYFIGDVLISIAAYPDVLASGDGKTAEIIFILGLFACIGIGTGAIKSNVITLGADQFNPADERESAQKITFFSWFYWSINFGAGFSYGYLATLCVKGSPQIPKEYGYFATFSICAGVFAFALLVFFIGSPRYIKLAPNSFAMSKLVHVLTAASGRSTSAKFAIIGFFAFLTAFVLNLVAVFLKDGSDQRRGLTYTAGGVALVGVLSWVTFGQRFQDMDKAKQSQGGPADDVSVDETKLVVRILPFAALTVMWQCVYDQIDANFQSIAQQSDLRFGDTRDATQLPGAVLGVFDPIAIVILIPVLESVIYPLYKKATGKDPSPFGKVAAGLVISTATMFYVGVFETVRRNAGNILLPNATNPEPYPILDVSSGLPMNQLAWGWNIPQYILVALCECLINVTAYDVFYAEVPIYLKSTCQAINLFMTSVGSNVTSIFTLLFQQYIPDDLNDGHLEYMFYGVGAVSVVNLLVYLVVMRSMQFGMASSKRGAEAIQTQDMQDIPKDYFATRDSHEARISYA